MSKQDDKKKKLYGQYAWILNYQPNIKEQHIHMGNQEVEDEPMSDEIEFEDVEDITSQPVEVANDEKNVYSTSISDCFRVTSEFVHQSVFAVVKDYYLGSAANLALIEITLFDHNLLQKRNSHTAFFKSLVAWGIITIANEEESKRIVRAIADKHKRLPEVGYKEWSKDYTNEKVICENIGKKLGQTIPYNR